MRKLTAVALLISITGLYVGCSADNPTGPTTGEGGAGGNAGGGGKGGGGTGGAAGSSAAGAGGTGGSGTGGGGMAGTSDGGDAGTDPDPCLGMYKPLPFVVSSGFTNLQFCGNGTCSAGIANFTRIDNPDCDETFPEGGVLPIPSEVDGGADAAEMGAVTDASDAGTDASDAPTSALLALAAEDAGTTEAGTDAGSDAHADVSVANSGDASHDGGAVDAAISDASLPPPACYKFLYDPACSTALCWGGVIFTQAPLGKDTAGICIEPGATKITFKAKASRPAARVKFGSTREGMGETEFFLNITTDWAAYEIALPDGEPYNSYTSSGVWNGFSVIVEPQDHTGGTYIFVKDVVWVKN